MRKKAFRVKPPAPLTPQLTVAVEDTVPLVIVVVVLLAVVAIVPGMGVAGRGLWKSEARLNANTPRTSSIASRARFEAQRSREMIQQTGF